MPRPTNHSLRVFIADSQPLFRGALGRTIRQSSEMTVVGETGDGRVALEQIRHLSPDVALVDLVLRDLDGRAVVGAIRRDRLPTRCIVLADPGSGNAWVAVAAGAAAFLARDATEVQLCRTIRAVAGGGTVLGAGAQRALAADVRARAIDDRPLLSPRERDVLTRIADGKTAAQIAGELHVAVATVKTHTLRVYDKLEVGDRAAAVATAMRRGVLE
jgi:two-component system nitrate/nitrite response regulator NarL